MSSSTAPLGSVRATFGFGDDPGSVDQTDVAEPPTPPSATVAERALPQPRAARLAFRDAASGSQQGGAVDVGVDGAGDVGQRQHPMHQVGGDGRRGHSGLR